MDTNKAIQHLSDLYNAQQLLVETKKNLIETLIPADVKKAIQDVEDEFKTTMDSLLSEINKAESQVKGDVVFLGKTMKAGNVRVNFNSGKTTWDTDLLNDYLEKHPKSPIAKAKSEGRPYASIYKVG